MGSILPAGSADYSHVLCDSVTCGKGEKGGGVAKGEGENGQGKDGGSLVRPYVFLCELGWRKGGRQEVSEREGRRERGRERN